MTEWTDLFEGRVETGARVDLYGNFRGPLMEELNKGVNFSIQPGVGDSYAPMVDGDPFVVVNFPTTLNDSNLRRMQFACRYNGRVRVIGTYTPESGSEMLGRISASSLEF